VGYPKGTSGNPGGKPSIARDLERARTVAVPPDVLAVIDRWTNDEPAKLLADLGPEKFLEGFRAELLQAAERVPAITPADARAMWWRTILPVAWAGPSGPKDSSWVYAQQETGNRLLGKPKDHVVIEGSPEAPIDWSKVPPERREKLLEALAELEMLQGADGPVEH
jgi:hypothetical protein